MLFQINLKKKVSNFVFFQYPLILLSLDRYCYQLLSSYVVSIQRLNYENISIQMKYVEMWKFFDSIRFRLFPIQIMTATVETVAEQLDLAAIMPAEKVVAAVARSVTLTEADTGKLINPFRNEFVLNKFYF